MTGTVEAWDRLHTQRRHRLNFPSEDVVRFLAALNSEGVSGRGLDVGCGAGRHMFLLKQYGFQAVGVDSSQGALEQAARYGETFQADMTELPFELDQFDVALCMGAAYYGTRQNTVETFAEMRRVLKPGAYLLATLRTYRDWRMNAGRAVGTHTVLLNIPGEPEDGMVNNFYTETELEALVAGGWSKVGVELTERTVQQMKRLESDFLLTLQK